MCTWHPNKGAQTKKILRYEHTILLALGYIHRKKTIPYTSETGKKTLEEYKTKHHPYKHHRTFRPLYVANSATKFNESFATAINQFHSVCKGAINTNPQSKKVLQNRQTKHTDK